MAGHPISLGPKQAGLRWTFDSSRTILMIILVIRNWNKTFSTVSVPLKWERRRAVCTGNILSCVCTMSGRESKSMEMGEWNWLWNCQDEKPCWKRGGGGRSGGETDRRDSWSFPIPGSSPLGESVVFPTIETPCNLPVNLPPTYTPMPRLPLLIL